MGEGEGEGGEEGGGVLRVVGEDLVGVESACGGGSMQVRARRVREPVAASSSRDAPERGVSSRSTPPPVVSRVRRCQVSSAGRVMPEAWRPRPSGVVRERRRERDEAAPFLRKIEMRR